MYLKRWTVALLAVLALVACGSPAVDAVARVDNVVLSRQELDQRITRLEQGFQKQPQQGPAPSRLDIEQRVVSLFIDQNLVLGLAKQRGVSVTDKEIDAAIGQFRDSVTQSGAQSGAEAPSFDQVVQDQLGLPGGDSTEFRQFASFFVARQKLAETLVTTDTVRQQVTDQVMTEANKPVLKGTVAHILIGVPQGGDAAADAAALAKAKDIIARLDKGEKFEDLAKQFSEDPGSKDNGGVYEDITQGQFVPEFDKAMFQDLQPGETTKEPVKTQFGYHIIKLISRSEGPAMNEEQAKQQIEAQIGQALQQQRGQEFEKLLADEHAKAKQEGRLVEPDYPDPTAVPAPPAEQPPAEQPTATPAS
ncbi:MAG TPA: peptidylprolyl isomerase [Roseiflexaceae bacterium]|nr:peptidylprolyl isomerase [Roseiflexaceae bacterium]